jgi:hypothetical protein
VPTSLDLTAALAAAAAPAAVAPNMIGDFFNIPMVNGTGIVTLSTPFTARFVGATQIGSFSGFAEYLHPLGGEVRLFAPLLGTIGPFDHDYDGATGPLTQFGPASPGTIDPSDVNTAVVNSELSTRSQVGGSAFNEANRQIQQLVPAATLRRMSALMGSTARVAAGAAPGTFDLEYDGTAEVEVEFPLVIALPGGGRPGAQIGQMKVSENNSVLPRDRVIFDYNHFNSVPIAPGGVTINRYAPGFEKTFLDGLFSFETLFPFAATLENGATFDGVTESNEMQFGNIRMFAKALLYNSERWKFATGLGIEIPTAEDLSLGLLDGTELLRIENEAVHLQPFVGSLYTPNRRAFVQSFLQVNVDVNGNPVLANPDFTTIHPIGRLYTQPLLLLDGQAGYWVYRSDDPNNWLSGVAGIVELHFNTTLGDSADLVEEDGFAATNLLGDFQIVNLTLGSTIALGRTQIQLAAMLPLTEDRSFDYEFAVYVNHYFGSRRM